MSATRTNPHFCIHSTDRHFVECLGASVELVENPPENGDTVLIRTDAGWEPATVAGYDTSTDTFWVTTDEGITHDSAAWADVQLMTRRTRPPRPGRMARKIAFGVLATQAAALLAGTAIVVLRPDNPAPARHTVVESRCIDGHIDQSIDDGNPSGLIAYDTGVPC